MADEPDNETQDTPPEETEQAPETPASEAEVTETPAPEAEVTEPTAPEAQGADAPAAGAEPTAEAGEDAGAPAAESVASEPVVRLPPKQRRRAARSAHSGEVRPSRSAEERHAERVVERRKKAISRRARRLQERAKAAERRATAPAPEPLAPVHAPVEGRRRERQGVVVSDKAEKTITVRIDVARRHRRYEKIVRSSSTLHAHDENNDANEGDVVRVIESRPLSRTKRWTLVDVLERAR
jgi:small subunit ribosomal protein S17